MLADAQRHERKLSGYMRVQSPRALVNPAITINSHSRTLAYTKLREHLHTTIKNN
ncbi:hypothetical protein ALO61_200054 [Pseudomonas savastanoi pv. nerii]|nr:hypothetical protein ALO61_200054 [Pseudomonas savastanoi pv. nerii]RMN74613.1 hypothetical protein ALQ55_200308 [Pseudomonas savastanoi pv. savastanoi]